MTTGERETRQKKRKSPAKSGRVGITAIYLRDNNLHLYSKSSPCILKLSYKMLSFKTVGFQTHKLLPLLCRPANLKQELISTGSEEHEHVYHCRSF